MNLQRSSSGLVELLVENGITCGNWSEEWKKEKDVPWAITMTSRALMAAARIRTSADLGGMSSVAGMGTEVLRCKLSSASKERQSFGADWEICQAEDVMAAFIDWSVDSKC